MISIIVINPNIFNLDNLETQEKDLYLNQLITWCKFCCPKNAVIVFDKNSKLNKVFSNYINNENKIEIKKKLATIWKFINTSILRSKFSSRQFEIDDDCKLCFSLIDKSTPDMVFIQKLDCSNGNCKDCIQTFFTHNLEVQYSNQQDTWNYANCNYSDVPEKYNFESFVSVTKFRELIRCCKDFTLYDKNIIPEYNNKISEEYVYNLEKFIKLFKGFDVNLNIITYVKKTQLQEAEKNIKQTINTVNKIANANNVPISFKVLIGENENEKYMEQIHNRYIFTNIVNYSTDRGLNIINKTTGLNRSFEINLISKEKANLFQGYLSGLKEYKNNENTFVLKH